MLSLDCFVCGLARDCASVLPWSLSSLDGLLQCFRRADVLVVTNDSIDDTSQVLARWATGSASKMMFRPEGIATAVARRTDRLATLRNFYLLEMRRRIGAGRRFDLMIVFDFDGVNKGPDLAGAVCNAILTAPSDWGGLFANQRQAYYDIWALRHPKWCPGDCWQEVGRSTKFLRGPLHRFAATAAVQRYLGRRQVKIKPDEPPIPVQSAFGGLGIYKLSALDGAWYCGRDEAGLEVCEHVAFHACIRQRGSKLYIMPGLLNDAPLEHLAQGAGQQVRLWD